MIKSVKTIMRQDRELYRVPRRVQDAIPIQCVWSDGIFRVGNKFFKTYRFTDINYFVASREDKESMFLTYSELLNSLDSAATTKLTICNRRQSQAELDVEEPEVKVTIVKETDQESTEEGVDPKLLLVGWETDLARQVESGHYPGVTPTTARHELYGFKVALKDLGLLDAEECYVLPGVFGSEAPAPADLFAARKERLARQISNPHYPDTDERTAAHELYGYTLALQDLGLIKEYDERFRATLDTFEGIRKAEGRMTFKGLLEEVTAEPFILEAARKVYALDLLLSESCPDNDCRVYLNTFNMARERDAALNTAQGYAANVLRQRLTQLSRSSGRCTSTITPSRNTGRG